MHLRALHQQGACCSPKRPVLQHVLELNLTQTQCRPPPRSVLLRDSFVDSFPPRDRPFMRQFAETQMFAVYCDAVLDGAAAGPR